MSSSFTSSPLRTIPRPATHASPTCLAQYASIRKLLSDTHLGDRAGDSPDRTAPARELYQKIRPESRLMLHFRNAEPCRNCMAVPKRRAKRTVFGPKPTGSALAGVLAEVFGEF